MNLDSIADVPRGSRIELGTGNKPTPGYLHADRWKHSPHIDVEFPLEKIPWNFPDNHLKEILATDVFEHLKLDVQVWLDECWRVLETGGLLNMRLPLYSNPYSFRDPTHYRIFHPESFLYWCPDAAGTVWKDFGRYYFGPEYNKWWREISRKEECKDLRITLQKL